MKTCQSCKWCEFYTKHPDLSLCKAPESYTHSPVSEELKIQKLSFCEILRTDDRFGYPKCGTRGKWWKPKNNEDATKASEKLSRLEKFVAWIKRS